MGWTQTTIGHQVLLQRGIDITKAEQRPGSVPVISSGGFASTHDVAAASGPGVVLGRKGVVGSVWYVDTDYWPHDTTLWVKDFKGNHPRFVYYFFKAMARRLASLDVGSANPTLNRNHVHPTEVLWPDSRDQRAIASVLGALDDKIEVNQRTNETLEKLARTIFKSWFVDFDPVRAKSEGRQPVGMDPEAAALFPSCLVESEEGPIPKGWEWRTVEEIQDGPRGTTAGPFGSNLTRKDYVESGVPVIRGENMRGDGPWFKDEDFVFVSHDKAATLASNLARPGDVLFTQRGTLGQVAIIPDDARFTTYILSQSQMRLTTKLLPPLYVYLHFSEEKAVSYIIANSTAAGVPHINLGFLRRMLLCVPSETVLAAFQHMTGTLMDRLLASARESRTLADLRDLLLPRLISGELRVPTAEKMVEAAL